MKKLMVAMAIAGAVGMAQASFSDLEGFENLTVGNKLSIDKSGLTWSWTAAAADIESGLLTESVITNYAGTGDTALDNAGLNFLALTGVERLERYVVPQDNETEAGFDVTTSTTGELYIDTLVKFTVTEDDAPTPTADVDKLCIWVGINNGETNLMVTAGYVNDLAGNTIATNYVTSYTFTDTTINQWHRLKVKVLPFIDSDSLGALGDGFVITVDDTEVALAGEDNTICDELFQQFDPVDTSDDDELNTDAAAYYTAKKLFPSLIGANTGAGTITSVGFKGSGAIDNLQFSETDPNPQQTGWKDASDPDVYASMTNQTAATIYPTLVGTSLANADAAKLTLWATDATKGNLAFTDAENDNVTQTTVEAFLLNCAVADVATEKAEFTVNITWNETTQTWDVTGPAGKDYNGVFKVKGSDDLTVPKTQWDEYDPTTDTFMYGVLELN